MLQGKKRKGIAHNVLLQCVFERYTIGNVFSLNKDRPVKLGVFPGEAQERVGYNEVDSIFYSTQEDVL